MSEENKLWIRNVEYFDREKDNIRRQYGEDMFVVIRNQQIVDSGSDKLDLARKYDKQSVLITSIRSSGRFVELPSPKIVR